MPGSLALTLEGPVGAGSAPTTGSAGGSYKFHLTLTFANTTGMHNLFRLGSYA